MRLLRHYSHIARATESSFPRFGAYQATRIIGRGGMGVVYEAHRADGEFERRVAIKVLPTGTLAPSARYGLREERQILAHLSHPNIAQLYDGGVTATGEPFLVVEFVEGEHFDLHCRRHNLSPAARLRLFDAILDAVEFIHRHGVIHQDLKPSNILITPSGQPKLLDFGASRLLHNQEGSLRRLTPKYASPESLAGQPVGLRADVYSLGVIYADILGTAADAAITRKATAPLPEHRYASVAEFRQALRARARRVWVALASLAALAAIAWLAWIQPAPPLLRPIPPPDASWREASLSWSGHWLAFSGGDTPPSERDIWLSRPDGSSPQRLFADPFQDQDPTVSNDGRFVAFHSNRHPEGIFELDRSSGTIRSLAPGGHLPQYSPDGRWLLFAASDDRPDPIRVRKDRWFVQPARGGQPRNLAPELVVSHALWAPDSQSVLLQAKLPQRVHFNSLWQRRLDATQPTLAAEWGGSGIFLCAITPDGKAALGISGDNYLARVTLPSQATRSLERIVPLPPLSSHCTIDRNGRVIVQSQSYHSQHYFLPLGPNHASPQQIDGPPGGYVLTSVSRDSKLIAFRHALRSDSIVIGPSGSHPVAGTAILGGNGNFAWIRSNSGVSHLSQVILPGFRARSEFLSPGHFWSVTADGLSVLGSNGTIPRPVTLLGDGHRTAVPILTHPQWNLYRARTSVDGKWVAFSANDPESGMRILLAPFRGAEPVPPAEWFEVAEGTGPDFSNDGNSLYFTSKRDGYWCIYSQQLHPLTRRPVGPPQELAHLHGEYSPAELPGSSFMLSASSDGLRFSLGRQLHVVSEYRHKLGRP